MRRIGAVERVRRVKHARGRLVVPVAQRNRAGACRVGETAPVERKVWCVTASGGQFRNRRRRGLRRDGDRAAGRAAHSGEASARSD